MKLAMYIDTQWGLGNLHRGLAAHLRSVHGWQVDEFDWAKQWSADTFSPFDRVLTVTGKPLATLLDSFSCQRSKVRHVAHDEEDFDSKVNSSSSTYLQKKHAVVSDTMVASLTAIGHRHSFIVLPLGIEYARLRKPIRPQLQTLGYLSVLNRQNAHGIERKRGDLFYQIAEKSGLIPVLPNSPKRADWETYPSLFDSFDCLIYPSLTEGAGYPPLEAAAAGKLVLGTPAGMFPRLASEGIGLMGPIEADRFVDWAVRILDMLEHDRDGYLKICQRSQQAAAQYDWSKVGSIWKEFIES
jgi:hypothetical protein